MQVEINLFTRQVILIGADGAYQAYLNWSSALELGSQLQAAACAVELPPPPGRVYCPATER